MTNAVARPTTRPSPTATPAPPPDEAAPVAQQAIAPATDTPHMHDLFVEAGGDTDAYDSDRYMGLLRDHGYIKERRALSVILTVALQVCRDSATDPETLAGPLAKVLTDELGRDGWRIHDVVRCVRPTGDPLLIGRPMTRQEELDLVINGEPLPHPRRRR